MVGAISPSLRHPLQTSANFVGRQLDKLASPPGEQQKCVGSCRADRRSDHRHGDPRSAATSFHDDQHSRGKLSLKDRRKAGLFPRAEDETRPAPFPSSQTFQNGPRRQGSATPRKTSAPLTAPGRSGTAPNMRERGETERRFRHWPEASGVGNFRPALTRAGYQVCGVVAARQRHLTVYEDQLGSTPSTSPNFNDAASWLKPPDSQSGDRGFESRHRRQNGSS